MIDLRIYRAALLPALVAFVVLMFSLEPVPNPLQGPVSAPEFDGSQAAREARRIVALAPSRQPGSEGDRTIAALVRDEFAKVEGGEVATQDFSASFRGNDIDLQNVILTIPGGSERTLLVLAGRDSADGPGAASSASATAELLALADVLGDQRHERTIVLASTDGSSADAAGARELASALPQAGEIDAAIVLSQSGVANPAGPFVVTSGTGPESPAAQLARTARAAASDSFEVRDTGPGAWVGLARLAVPAALGEQAPLRAAGIEAVRLSGHGEGLIDPADDGTVSGATLTRAGTAALSLILTLDGAATAPAAGPADYVRIGANLIPGWTIALLALTLLAPPILLAIDTWLRGQRADWRVRRTIPWALERALLPLAALLLALGLAAAGLIPDPGYPYDPAAYPPGVRAPIAFVALAGAAALAGLLVRPMRTPLDVEPHHLAAAAGLTTGGALIGLWLLNPYLALLLVPAAHVWLLPARTAGSPSARVVAGGALLSLSGALAASITVAVVLGLGAATPWHWLLMITSGQVGLGSALLWGILLGGLIACVSATAAGRAVPPSRTPRLRGAGTHIGPGALGSSPAAEPRHR